MRRWAQASQRSTWPPNAAVRQRSIADMTLSWPRLTWPAWEARHAGPRWRKMSATSTAGRDNGCASPGWLHLGQQQVEGTGHLTDRLDGDAGVERRRVELLVSEQSLDGRVGVWRGGGRPNISVAAPFVWRCLTGSTLAPFPHSAHRTGRADFPHPALGQDSTPIRV